MESPLLLLGFWWRTHSIVSRGAMPLPWNSMECCRSFFFLHLVLISRDGRSISIFFILTSNRRVFCVSGVLPLPPAVRRHDHDAPVPRRRPPLTEVEGISIFGRIFSFFVNFLSDRSKRSCTVSCLLLLPPFFPSPLSIGTLGTVHKQHQKHSN